MSKIQFSACIVCLFVCCCCCLFVLPFDAVISSSVVIKFGDGYLFYCIHLSVTSRMIPCSWHLVNSANSLGILCKFFL